MHDAAAARRHAARGEGPGDQVGPPDHQPGLGSTDEYEAAGARGRVVIVNRGLDPGMTRIAGRDLDYAEAVSRMNQQLTGLQAAQAAYSRIARLSLFDFL